MSESKVKILFLWCSVERSKQFTKSKIVLDIILTENNFAWETQIQNN